jgi:hypothetical protein
MSSNHHFDPKLQYANDRMRQFHQEAEQMNLAREVKNGQPGLVSTVFSRLVNLLTVNMLKLEKRFASGRSLRKQAIAKGGLHSLRSTHLEL